MKSVQWNFLKVTAVALLVAGCGGGGGGATDGGTTSNPPPATGSTKTTFVTGAIAGFGSVIVNGVRYDTDSAQVSIEDKPATAAELKVGEVIHLTAEVDAQGVARAKSITQDHLIQGAVQAVDTVAGTLTIAGQVITVDNETMFDDSIPTRTLAGIAVGDLIEVHGFAAAGGTARATRIEKAERGRDGSRSDRCGHEPRHRPEALQRRDAGRRLFDGDARGFRHRPASSRASWSR